MLKYLRDNEGKDPITGDTLKEEDLVEIKTGEWAGSIGEVEGREDGSAGTGRWGARGD